MESQTEITYQRESLIKWETLKFILWAIGFVLFLGGLTLFLLWIISLDKRAPITSIEQFDILTPNTSASSMNATRRIFFDLKLKNDDTQNRIHYYSLNLTVYYMIKSNLSFVPIKTVDFEPFYQGTLRSTHRTGYIEASGVFWEKSLTNMTFRAEMRSNLRYREPLTLHYTKRHNVALAADLKVDGEGHLVRVKTDKGIRLTTSGVAKVRAASRYWPVLLVLLYILL